MHWSKCIALYRTMGQSKSIQVIYCIKIVIGWNTKYNRISTSLTIPSPFSSVQLSSLTQSCPTLSLEKCKSNLQMRFYITSVTMPIINKSTNNAGEDVEKRDPSCAVRGNVNSHSHYGGQYAVSLKRKWKYNYYIIQQSHWVCWDYHNSERHMHIHVHCSPV